MHASASMKASMLIAPARTSSLNAHMFVPEPMSSPRNLPFSIGPPDSTIVGRSQLAAPIMSEGVVLSQPTSRTTPSSGLARMLSSTSIAARLRNSIVVGRIIDSPSDIAGNSSGNPPASYTPRFTRSATMRKCALHGVSSDHVLQIPITGRPSNRCDGTPWFRIHPRWMKLFSDVPLNQAAERSFFINPPRADSAPGCADSLRRRITWSR